MSHEKRMWIDLDTDSILKEKETFDSLPPLPNAKNMQSHSIAVDKQDVPHISKNLLFDTYQAVLKPATKMSHDELELLRHGKILPDKNNASVTHTCEYPSSESDSVHKSADTSVLSRHFEKISLAPIDKVIQPLKIQTNAFKIDMIQSESISLVYLPIKKNLLGEGRYSQVYYGEYLIDKMDSAEIESPDSVYSASTLKNDVHSHPFMQPCAVKRVYSTLEAQTLGLSETYILKRLSHKHPNIIQFIGCLDENDLDSPTVRKNLLKELKNPNSYERMDPSPRLLVILEYLALGNSWDWALRNRNQLGSQLWLKWARQIASAFVCIHSLGIIHHDLKPQNLLLTDSLDIRVADFGNACYVPEIQYTESPSSPLSDESSLTLSPSSTAASPTLHPGTPAFINSQSLQDGIGRGTLAYMAPEILLHQNYTFSVDIYSMGVTLLSLLVGKDPFIKAKTNIQMMMGIKKGFFESGMQAEFNNKYLNGEDVKENTWELLESMVSVQSFDRPSSTRILEKLKVL